MANRVSTNDCNIYGYFENIPFFTHVIRNEYSFLHSHNFIELFYISDGESSHLINGKEDKLKQGDLTFLRPKDEHMFLNVTTTRSTRRDLLFAEDFFKSVCDFIDPNFYKNFLNEKEPLKINCSASKIREIEKNCSIIQSMINHKKTKDEILIFLKIFCMNLLELFFSSRFLSVEKPQRWITDLVTKLDNGISIETPLSEIISEFHFNKAYIERKFKQYTGVTITQYRLETQLKYAAFLLNSSDETIEKISELSGFNNYPYFFKSFKKKYGLTPLKYRTRKL